MTEPRKQLSVDGGVKGNLNKDRAKMAEEIGVSVSWDEYFTKLLTVRRDLKMSKVRIRMLEKKFAKFLDSK